MSEIDPRPDVPPLDWSELGMNEPLPTGTVTLLLADVQGSTQLWDSQPQEMTAAIAKLDQTLAELVSAHHGVRPVEQGEGDSFVIAFSRASDAVTCALALQRAPLAPLRLRIGVHTGEVQLRDENNYVGPAINRTARLRELAHGGQTVLSGTTSDLVADTLSDDAWLTDLGTHPLRDLPRPERVVQLCHPDLCNEFPPLRKREAPENSVAQHLPAQLTSFVGRDAEMGDVRSILAHNRLVTLTGAGGVGKTRLAVQVAASVADDYADGICYVDLAPITDPDLVPIIAARTLGLPDQPGRSPEKSLLQFIGDKHMLMVLDNCEHLLDASAGLAAALLAACPRLTALATSREPIGMSGEVIWRVPSLSFEGDAARLFEDRARHARPGFSVDDVNAAAVNEICRRLDGMPLAIELAAARVRALSADEILAGLQDRFRLLTGGSRTAVRRQQTLQASVDWSHALLTEPERILFRRLGVFMGGFDLDACREVVCDKDLGPHQVLDVLALLIDKSLVIAESVGGATRYRLLETIRQYAQERLSESAEAIAVRDQHRDHYIAMAATLDAPGDISLELLLDRAQAEIDNLRAAFGWSRENSDTDSALRLATSLQPLWLTRGGLREGSDWLDAGLADAETGGADVTPQAMARGLADKAFLDNMRDAGSLARAQRSLAIARELDDPLLLARTLTACGRLAAWDARLAQPYLSEADNLARATGDRWRLAQILYSKALTATVGTGDPDAVVAAAAEGRDLADAIGDQGYSRGCRWCLIGAQWVFGDATVAATQLRELITEADEAHSLIWQVSARERLCHVSAHTGRPDEGRAVGLEALDGAAEIGRYMEGVVYSSLAFASLAAGDIEAASEASDAARERFGAWPLASTTAKPAAQVALACGDLASARRFAEEDVAAGAGWFTVQALLTRARVALAENEPGQAERDVHDALTRAAELRAHLFVPDLLECLARLGHLAGSHLEAARLFGAAYAVRERTGIVRFRVYDADYEASVDATRNALTEKEFDAAWHAGTGLSTDEAIAYARRGRGERKRPPSGWDSLTPTERDVVRLVSEGLGNKDIGDRLFISPRTVQTHLTHVYAKLGLTTRIQLAQEASRRSVAD
ncbi:LuxR C-terminal-related transcriptional regulator [Mycobacterium sp. 852002-51971_SCH5477799-a]|uniref:helix-turn-helix transcriptional regulator n=1 Tax=Mycobacterium sp. 852002-51971_SCH5477799-a TaxID=1834106 RepID=UPI001E506878|nr:LuxR family transcriptional regulator [Mycobacterium sp. 852002-51971_SCH5477799-a]